MIGYHKKNFGIWSACIGFELRLWYNASGSGSWLKFSVFLDSFKINMPGPEERTLKVSQ